MTRTAPCFFSPTLNLKLLEEPPLYRRGLAVSKYWAIPSSNQIGGLGT